MALHGLLENSPDIEWVRKRTARRATLVSELSDECWPGMESGPARETATAGLLSAGSYARPTPETDVQPLLSVRVHAFFRGISGLWACIDPDCPAVAEEVKLPGRPRPVGKIYTDPRPWCDCGARVLELFSCRRCGLLFVGGIPDQAQKSLWPWSDDLSAEQQDLKTYRDFGVERPHPSLAPIYRSTRTTLACHVNDTFAREVWEIESSKKGAQEISPFPMQCPRCQNYRAVSADGREIIEPLRTKGPQSFSLIVEDGFRVQPRAGKGKSPNFGRKALLFSDSRQEAAKLAADLRNDHARDTFRQLLFKTLHTCPVCNGLGIHSDEQPLQTGQSPQASRQPCSSCNGTGSLSAPAPLSFGELRKRVIELEYARGINPTSDQFENFFADLTAGAPATNQKAELYFNLALLRELSEDEIALEPLGLASWQVKLPTDEFSPLKQLTSDETRALLRSVARLLASENVLLPPAPFKPWEWPHDKVKSYDRLVLFWGSARWENAIPYNLEGRRKLGRYIIGISKALLTAGRLPDKPSAERWVSELRKPLWDMLIQAGVLQSAGAPLTNKADPFGIRIDAFELHPIGDQVHRCQTCAYVMSDAPLHVCLRCGQPTKLISAKTIRNYYRRAALLAQSDSIFEDPYPLRAIEHTGQIAGGEARDLERWFQDLFHDDQNALDKRVDVLSVTTTMEMGIDIGSLLCVGLRNIPPSVANYQQRAGRAGRRGSAIATVLAFAQQRSHDQYYFSQPPEIVSSPPRVPSLYLSNDVIARRHVRALLMQDFFHHQRGTRVQGL